MTPGIHTISAAAYHADDIADVPTLSASIANVLCTQSPAHAWAAHPKLNPNLQRDEDDKFDIGTCAHALLLEGNAAVCVVKADDWRTKAAKETRVEAREAGLIALLEKHWLEVQAIVVDLRLQLAVHEATPTPFTAGKPERVLVWEEPGGVVCRARVDWLHDDLSTIDDLKTTKASANPEQWTRTLYSIGADVQVAFYLRGLEATTGQRVDSDAFRFVVVECAPPYALSVVSLAPDAYVLARKKVEYAIELWRRCVIDDRWPAYPSRVAHLEAPAWEESRWLAKELREVAA